MNPEPASPMPAHHALPERERGLALAVLGMTMFLELFNNALLNVALPTIITSLHASQLATQWIVTGYALGFGSILLLAGRLSDRFGHRLVLISGMALFVLASLGCALSLSSAQLIAGRTMQGAACALIAPQIMGFLQILYAPQDRARKAPWIGLGSCLAMILGPLFGGLALMSAVSAAGWRAVFVLDAAAGSVILVAALLFLPGGTASDRRGLDLRGGACLAVAVTCFIVALTWLPQGWGKPWLAIGLLAGPSLAWLGWRHAMRQTRLGLPAIIAPDVFKDPALRLGIAITACFATCNANYLIILNLLLQMGRGHSAMVAGLMHLPYSFGALVSMTLVARHLLVHRGKLVLSLGAVLVIVNGSAALAMLSRTDWPALWAVPVIAGLGLGVGMTSACIAPVSLARVNVAHAGMAAALLRVGQQCGWALGSALIVRPYAVSVTSEGRPQAMAIILLTLAMLAAIALISRLPSPLFPATGPSR